MTGRGVAIALVIASRSVLADPTPDAAQRYRDGQAAYDQARYDDALASWQQSYALSHAPGLLYNLAQAYRLRDRAGDCVAARERYQRFVSLAQPSPQRELAERYITELAACAAPPLSGASPTTSATVDDTLRTRELEVGAVGVVGLGLLVTGIALGHHAATLGNDVTNACAVSCDWSAEKSKDAEGRRDSALGWTFGAIGVVELVGDAALYYFGVREHGISVAVPPSREPGAVVTWGRSW
jgi:tetratricopeptide (TPR) repeat protein